MLFTYSVDNVFLALDCFVNPSKSHTYLHTTCTKNIKWGKAGQNKQKQLRWWWWWKRGLMVIKDFVVTFREHTFLCRIRCALLCKKSKYKIILLYSIKTKYTD